MYSYTKVCTQDGPHTYSHTCTSVEQDIVKSEDEEMEETTIAKVCTEMWEAQTNMSDCWIWNTQQHHVFLRRIFTMWYHPKEMFTL